MSSFEWWQKAVFYQIYPRSFADGNGDGMGDFEGMVQKLDYLQSLGVDAIWLSPHYPSPFIDCGYDISDYEGIAPEYGDMVTFKKFLDGLHERGMHLILDLVLNHTSNKHPWFVESRTSLDSPKRDWYIWKKGKDGKPPTNWYSTFGGSAWELDPATGEYYYHFFFKEQPDLNWNHPEVKQAMFNMVRFWLNMGVDGFRLDAVGTIFEDEHYFDHTEKRSLNELIQLELNIKSLEERANFSEIFNKVFQYQHDMPGVHELMRELRQVVNEYDHRVLVGETDDLSFYGNGKDELDLVFNFPLMKTAPQLNPPLIHENQKARLAQMPAGTWPCNTFGNHDSPRSYSHFGDGSHNSLQAKQLITLLLTLKGTPFLYNGEEIGMSDYFLQKPSLFRDPLSQEYTIIIQELQGLSEKEATHFGAEHGRDKCRTPMQWTNAANAGFCPEGVTPWLPINPDYRQGVNVAEEFSNANSLLNYYRKMLALRKSTTTLQTGNFEEILDVPQEVYAYRRFDENGEYLIVINYSESAVSLSLPSDFIGNYRLVIEGNNQQWMEGDGNSQLAKFGCIVLRKLRCLKNEQTNCYN
jgi:alpha-glucosidase